MFRAIICTALLDLMYVISNQGLVWHWGFSMLEKQSKEEDLGIGEASTRSVVVFFFLLLCEKD